MKQRAFYLAALVLAALAVVVVGTLEYVQAYEAADPCLTDPNWCVFAPSANVDGKLGPCRDDNNCCDLFGGSCGVEEPLNGEQPAAGFDLCKCW